MLKKAAADFTIKPEKNGDGNYTICVENLSKGTKTLTIYWEKIQASIGGTENMVEKLDEKIRILYFSLIEVSANIGKLRTRETVHFESKKAE